jgi:hypothetical protein
VEVGRPMDIAKIGKKIEIEDYWRDAFTNLAKLPAKNQDTIVYWMLEDIKLDKLWDETLERTADKLAELMDKSIAEHKEYLREKEQKRKALRQKIKAER